MKAITVWQPWASLIAVCAKIYETRSWATKYRGPIAIHAGKMPYNLGDIDFALARGIMSAAEHIFGIYEANNLPLGAVIATAELVECWPIVGIKPYPPAPNGYCAFIEKPCASIQHSRTPIDGNELIFGDWTPGRFAWQLANVKMLPEPMPARGRQGLWDWRTTV